MVVHPLERLETRDEPAERRLWFDIRGAIRRTAFFPGAVRTVVEAFAARRDEDRSVRQWIDETGTEAIVDGCEPAETTYEDPTCYNRPYEARGRTFRRSPCVYHPWGRT